jgi:hypothetical protein
MMIGNKDYRFKFSWNKLTHAFSYRSYFCRYRQKKDFSLWLDVNFFLVNLFFQREEATWYTIHVSFLGIGVPENGNIALLGFQRDHSWEDLELLKLDYAFEDHHLGDLIESSKKAYSINFLWFFDVEFSISTYFNFEGESE